MEMDVFYQGPECSMSYFSSYYDAYVEPVGNLESSALFTQLMKERRWGRIVIESKPIRNPDGVCNQLSSFRLNQKVVQVQLMSITRPGQVTLKPKKGVVRVDNIVIRELFTFE